MSYFGEFAILVIHSPALSPAAPQEFFHPETVVDFSQNQQAFIDLLIFYYFMFLVGFLVQDEHGHSSHSQ